MSKLVHGVGVNDLDYKVHVREYVTKDGVEIMQEYPVEFWETNERVGE